MHSGFLSDWGFPCIGLSAEAKSRIHQSSVKPDIKWICESVTCPTKYCFENVFFIKQAIDVDRLLLVVEKRIL